MTDTSLAAQTIHAGSLSSDLSEWQERATSEQLVERLARGDPSLWASNPETQRAIANRLGWRRMVTLMRAKVGELEDFADGVFRSGIRDVVLLGMGGSSLCPAVFGRMFERPAGHGHYIVLDSTDPDAVLRVERTVDLPHTLFVSASKSGKTIETLSHTEYFWYKMLSAVASRTGEHFVAVTDAGSPLERMARDRNFRRVFVNPPDIGGRYSALSYFGLVPGALAGVPLGDVLGSAMAAEAAGSVRGEDNPAVKLGLLLGGAAKAGLDKLTFLASPTVAPLIPWIEQLIAESTGKNHTGIIPIEGEPVMGLNEYGDDRCFVFFRFAEDADPSDGLWEQLIAAGRPTAEIVLTDRAQIGGEFFRWELATAVAGWVMGINPFDEPNVQESKDNTQMVLDQIGDTNEIGLPHPIAEGDGLYVLRDTPTIVDWESVDIREPIREWIAEVKESGYVALLAYLDDTKETEESLLVIREILLKRTGRATLRGYGPRYLHSIGQLYKGGPPTGAFLMITVDDADDARIPHADYTFSTLKMAQALGDAQSLIQRGRPFVHVHIWGEVARSLSSLVKAFESVE